MGDRHYIEVCEHGYVHGQCRCMGPKEQRRVECSNPDHAAQPRVGTHGKEYDKPPGAQVTLRFDGDDYGLNVGPFPDRAAADEWYALASQHVRESSADFTVLTDPDEALDVLRAQAGEYTDEKPRRVSCIIPDQTPASTRLFSDESIESMVGQRFRMLDTLRWDGPVRAWATITCAVQGAGLVSVDLDLTGPEASIDPFMNRWHAATKGENLRLAVGFTCQRMTGTHYLGPIDIMTGCPYDNHTDNPPRFARGGMLPDRQS